MSIDAALTRPTERCDVTFNGSSPPEPFHPTRHLDATIAGKLRSFYAAPSF